jgi:RNA polymerase sigma-70 factor, ECF subfamily
MDAAKRAIADEIPRLRRYARALSGSEADSDDLVQETLARALTHIDQWRSGESPRKWLFSILHNHFIDGVRVSSRQPHHLSIDAGDATPIDVGADAGIRRDLDMGLQALTIDQRQVLLLVGLEGLTYAETAEVLKVPIGTVMSRLARARDRLRVLMACDLTEADVMEPTVAPVNRPVSRSIS